MTRINMVPPEELTDQHLMREYQELPRVLALVKKTQEKGKLPKDLKIAEKYILGTGHILFFYNKLTFLKKRQEKLVKELLKRGYNIKFTEGLDLSSFETVWLDDYHPTIEDIELSRSRINEKIAMKPDWYRKTQTK